MVGAKLTVTLQAAPAARVYGGVAPQVVEVCSKSPLIWKLILVSAVPPSLVMVIVL